jgi:hypothetical protein
MLYKLFIKRKILRFYKIILVFENEGEQFHVPLKLCQPIIELMGQSAEDLIELQNGSLT